MPLSDSDQLYLGVRITFILTALTIAAMPLRAGQNVCMEWAMAGVPLTKLVFDTETFEVHTISFDPSQAGEVLSSSSQMLAHVEQMPATTPDKDGSPAKGSTLIIVASILDSTDSQPLLYYIDWDQGVLYRAEGHSTNPEFEFQPGWECKTTR